MKKIWRACLLIILLCCMSLIQRSVMIAQANEPKELNIVTSFYPMYAITKEIVGDLHEVRVLNSRNGIHGFEPSANDIAAIYDADIFIYHSNILESWTKNIAVNLKNSSVTLVEASRGMAMQKVTGLEDIEEIEGMDNAALYDPHTWLDPIEAGVEAQLIANRLSELDPDNQETYQANAKQFVEQAEQLVAKYQPIFEQLKQKTFVTQHTAFSYLAQRFNLKQLGIAGVSSDIEPSSKKIAEVQKFVNEYQVKTIFVEPNVSDRAAKVIANATGTTIVVLSPLEGDPLNTDPFLVNLEKVLETLSSHLQQEE
ncbi:zinc ABC transporter substrate-binding protein [Globicatella sulfidifaciens]|uniref:metal ABC transporter solute-binding protein, Zn/Mn family n=1 Tax=Globicatella sulfidifaciens TaxID=136093 RepID=UPI00288D5EEF|nr:zinc ABC transporter substrate-binding protein [Globicatella sulfidifaciens]MDT2769023.1 zinc ABC transporter substrate-binding protein [Globicatella sulfidifaciens]